jgi:hypothetical protein
LRIDENELGVALGKFGRGDSNTLAITGRIRAQDPDRRAACGIGVFFRLMICPIRNVEPLSIASQRKTVGKLRIVQGALK